MGAKEDQARRRLRAVYDTHKRRNEKLNEKRNKGGNSDNAAPKRFIVSEKQTRQAGFGTGRLQVSQSGRSRAGNKKFADRSVFRSAASKRGGNNDNNRGNNNGGRNNNNGGRNNNSRGNNEGGRFRRNAISNDRGRQALAKKAQERRQQRKQTRGGNNNGNGGNKNNNQKNNNNNRGNNNNNGGNNKNNNQKKQQQQPPQPRAPKAPVTFDSLDAALDKYKTA